MKKADAAIVLLSGIVVLASTGAAIVIQANANPIWRIQVVDLQGAGGKVVLDSQSIPHIFYHREEIADIDQQPAGLYHAFFTSQGWSIEHLDLVTGNIFIMDSENHPHVVSTSNGSLKDVPLSNPVWNVKDIGIAEVAGNTMVMDSRGTLHEISAEEIYFEGNTSYTSHLYYTTWAKSSVSVHTIRELNSTAKVAYQHLSPQSIILDAKSNPHIIFVEQQETWFYSKVTGSPSFVTTNTVKYAVWNGSNWTVQTLAENTGYLGGNRNFVLDSKGQPHLCYINENRTYSEDFGSYIAKRSLEYIYLDGSTWVNQTIESESNDYYRGQPALRLDSDGNPEVYFFKDNYQPETCFNLFHAMRAGSTWNVEKIWTLTPNSYGIAGISTIAFDPSGNPRLTYATVMGTYRSAYRYGNLTFLAIDMPFTFSPLFVSTVAGCTIASLVIALLVYLKKRKFKVKRD